MPSRKRKIENFDANKSDSADSTYNASTSRSARAKPSRNRQSKPSRKKQRRDYKDDSDEIIEPSEGSEGSLVDEIEEEEPEIDAKTGRPKRKAAQQHGKYQQSGSEGEDEIEDELGPTTEAATTPKKNGKPRSLVLKLKTPQNSSIPTRRSTRARSASVGTARPGSSEHPQRRSSRIAHDETSPFYALTSSGNHADVVRPGTRSPEAAVLRPNKGGKGVKKTSASILFEEDEGSPGQSGDNRQTEVAASHDGSEDELAEDKASAQVASPGEAHPITDVPADTQLAVIPDSGEDEPAEEEEAAKDDNDEDDEDPISKPRRTTRQSEKKKTNEQAEEKPGHKGGLTAQQAIRSTRQTRKTQATQKSARAESSDFEPGFDGGEEDMSDSDDSAGSPRKDSQQNDEDNSSSGRRGAGKGGLRSQQGPPSDEHDSAEEIAEELEDLHQSRPRRAARTQILFDDRPKRRKRKQVDYRIPPPDLSLPLEEDAPTLDATPSRRARGGAGGTWQRSLFSTYGPFGGAGGLPPLLGGPGGMPAAGGVDSDSSDDELAQRSRGQGLGGTLGMTPTAAVAPAGFGLFPQAQAQVHGADPAQTASGATPNVGRIKDKQLLADADPLGVDQQVSFDGVGGLQGHIDQLKEMVALPLLYPEVFQRFHITPPRGVLFHGPPGTGKTLLARALANSVSSQGRKVTFYMRKGADALSKWVGEAERQLRLLFDEARKTQPSIIFFDEIDGLAPVRSSKQEQIHASIVSTLLALMDGMDGRGQVIVIGATNRPDSVDPALRRPGRFDREFYFPLPNVEARRSILDIHTKGWNPPLTSSFKDEIAKLTKGYGGADLRALCTEAALNAIQRRYPQIYKSNEKLQIKPETINVTAKDFMISIKKMVPSSERSASSGAAPLPPHIEPLLRRALLEIEKRVAEILPQKKPLTALEDAEFEDTEDDRGLKKERMQQEFDRSRVFRPRLLVRGSPGMGQQYLAGALLNHFEGLHVQAFDLPTLLSDSTRSPEAAVIQLFAEVRRHKPSVIYIPNVNTWYETVGSTVISTFLGLLRTLAPTEPVLLFGILESEDLEINRTMIKDLFGFSRQNQFMIQRPERPERHEYFSSVINHVNISPAEFPESLHRRKKKLELLAPAPPPPPPKDPLPPTKSEMKAQKKRDRYFLNLLKLRIQPVMDQIRNKHKKFRFGVIDENQIKYLFDEDDPALVSTDLPHEQRRQDHFRPYEKGQDQHGEPGLIETATGNFYYNMDSVTIEKRLSNGYYKRPKDFLSDIKKLTKDAKTSGDQERLLKANELQANVEVDVYTMEIEYANQMIDFEAVYAREVKREKEMMEKANQLTEAEGKRLALMPSNVPPPNKEVSTEQSSGPIVLGQPMSNGITPTKPVSSHPSQPSPHSILTNGTSNVISDLSNLQPHGDSNGTSVPSREGDVQMTSASEDPSTERATQNSSFGPSAQSRPPLSYTGGPTSLQQRQSLPGSLSQRSAITPMAEGSNPQDYINYASSTSSDKRVSGSSGPCNTQSSRGKNEGPDLSMVQVTTASNSQLPSTQGSQSSGRTTNPPSSQSQPHSLAYSQLTPVVPPFPRSANPHGSASIRSLLNVETPSKPSQALVPNLIIDQSRTDSLLGDLTDFTSGCSVEQLEQVYSAVMHHIWQTRGEWDRTKVADEVRTVLVDVLGDIKFCQDVGPGSLEVEE